MTRVLNAVPGPTPASLKACSYWHARRVYEATR